MKEEILKLTGVTIRKLRLERGLSQEDLGEKADFHYSYIGKLERGEINITLVNLERIAAALGVGIHQLFPFTISKAGFTEKEQLIHDLAELLRDQELEQVSKAKHIIEVLLE